MAKRPKRFEQDTSWEELGFGNFEGGVEIASFILGETDDPTAPVVFHGKYPPGSRTEPHHHVTDYAEIILSGTQQVTRQWYKAGDVRIIEAGTAYGPLIAGPEGCETLVIFRNQNSMSRGQKNPVDLGDKLPTPIES